ncbi:MAG: hypothetical protein AAF125_27750, partial [Chloroflexota bacterium]
MPARTVLAPVGAGKTEYALAQIAEVTTQTPFARVWVLLATDRQTSEFRNRLIQENRDRSVYFNVEFFTFPALYDRVLNLAGQPARKLSEPARLRLIRTLAERLVE